MMTELVRVGIHNKPDPEHPPPLQPAKVEPVAAVASKATAPAAWKGNFSEQSKPQAMLGPVTVPVPAPFMAMAMVALTVELSNSAITEWFCVIGTRQVNAPAHPPPPHPTKVEPDAAVAVRRIVVPVATDSEQSVKAPLLPQLIPVAVIVPAPVSLISVTVSVVVAPVVLVN